MRNEGTEAKPPIINLLLQGLFSATVKFPVLWQIIWGEQEEEKEVCPVMEAKDLLLFIWESTVVRV